MTKKYFIMKRQLLLCFLLLSAFLSYGQSNITNDYTITTTAGLSDTTAYTNALDAADWEPYRLQDTRLKFSFDNGFTIELKSAVELLNLGYPINIVEYKTIYPIGYSLPFLKLLPGNIIGMQSNCNQPNKNQ